MITKQFTRGATAALFAAGSMGLVGCSSAEKNPAARADCADTMLEDIRFIGVSKDGGINALNASECSAPIYSPQTSHDIGKILASEGFVIDCVTDKPVSFDVQTDEYDGRVNLSPRLIEKMSQSGDFADIPTCY